MHCFIVSRHIEINHYLEKVHDGHSGVAEPVHEDRLQEPLSVVQRPAIGDMSRYVNGFIDNISRVAVGTEITDQAAAAMCAVSESAGVELSRAPYASHGLV